MNLTRVLLFSLLAAIPLQAQSGSGGLQMSWVRHFTTGLAPSRGEAAAIATDRDGNVYVTGSSHAGMDGSDFLTVKYDPTGIELWSHRYNSRAGGEDVPSLIALDGDGNVIVCGLSTNELVTIKYDRNGVLRWIRTYALDSWSFSAPIALAIDDTGNVFVLEGRGMLLKYSPSGEQRWPAPSGTASIGGPQGQWQDASPLSTGAIPWYYSVDLGVDDSGYVYLLGGVSNWGWVDGYVEKYDGNGNVVWTTWRSGVVFDMEVDAAGNVYVTANDGNYWYDDFSPMFSLTKYDALGAEVWTRLDSTSGNRGWVASLSTDSLGHLFMMGSTSAVCYDTSGTRLWFVRGGSLMTVDAGGNMVVADTAGGRVMLSRYSLGFDTVWTRYVGTVGDTVGRMRALAMDNGGNLYVAGSLAGNYATIGYHPASDAQWVRSVIHKAPGNSYDYLSAMALDGNGNIVLGGQGGGGGQYPHEGFLTVTFTPSGDTLWARALAVQESSGCYLTALALDGDNNTIALGAIYRYPLSEMRLFKRSPSGELLWSVKSDPPDSSNDSPSSLAVDPSGNIYITGTRAPVNPVTWPNSELLTMKFTASGTLAWSRSYPGKGAGEAVAVGADGSVVVLGTVFESTASPALVVKYDSAGTLLWAKQEASYWWGRRRIATDRIGNIYTVRPTIAPDVQQNYPFVTTKYGSGGELAWTREFKYYAVGNGQDGPVDLAVDDSANVYVTGTSSIDTWMDIVTIKYSAGGELIWLRRHRENNYHHDQAASMALDSKGTIYVTGTTTLQYSTDGVEQVIGGDGIKVLVDRDDNLYVGRTTFGGDGSAMTVTKYSPITVTVQDGAPELPEEFALDQNFPNPFNPATDIRFRVAETRWVNVSVFDMLGREVAVLVNEELSRGEYNVRWTAASHASGVYFYRLKAGQEIAWRRMVLIR